MKLLIRFLVFVLVLTTVEVVVYYNLAYYGVSINHIMDRFYASGVDVATMFFTGSISIPNILTGLIRKKKVWWTSTAISLVIFIFIEVAVAWRYPTEFYPDVIAGLIVTALKYPLDKLLERLLPESYR